MTVRSDGDDLLGRLPDSARYLVCSLGEALSQKEIERAEVWNPAAVGIAQQQQRVAQLRLVRLVHEVLEPRLHALLPMTNPDQSGVDPIRGRSGHKADHEK